QWNVPLEMDCTPTRGFFQQLASQFGVIALADIIRQFVEPCRRNRMSDTKRVVITGMGLLSPVGNDVSTAWDNIKNGRSGIGPITFFDPSNLDTKIAGEVRNFDPKEHLDPKEARRMERFSQLAIVAARQAVKDANLEITDENSERI